MFGELSDGPGVGLLISEKWNLKSGKCSQTALSIENDRVTQSEVFCLRGALSSTLRSTGAGAAFRFADAERWRPGQLVRYMDCDEEISESWRLKSDDRSPGNISDRHTRRVCQGGVGVTVNTVTLTPVKMSPGRIHFRS